MNTVIYFVANQVARLIGGHGATILRWSSLELIDYVVFDTLPEYEKRKLHKHGAKPNHVYTFTSIVQAKVLSGITRQANINASTVKKVLDFLATLGESTDIVGLCLVRLNNNLLWVKKDEFGDLMRAIIVMGKKRGQYEFTPMLMLDDTLNELRHSVEVSNLEDYNKNEFINYLNHLRKAA